MDTDCDMDRSFAFRLRRQMLRHEQQLAALAELKQSEYYSATPNPKRKLHFDVEAGSSATAVSEDEKDLQLAKRLACNEECTVDDEMIDVRIDDAPVIEDNHVSTEKLLDSGFYQSSSYFLRSSSSASTSKSPTDYTSDFKSQNFSTGLYFSNPVSAKNGLPSAAKSLISPRSALKSLSSGSKSSPSAVGDRFIPLRDGCDWQTRLSMIPEGRGTGKRSSRDSLAGSSSGSGGGDSNRDGLAYTCLLRNEMLGTNIEAVKGQCDERLVLSSPGDRTSLFRYTRQEANDENNIESMSPYSLSFLGPDSQKLLRAPRKATRKISKIPFKVLDAPELQDDFYLNLVDWSSQNVLSVGLGSCVYLWSACTSQVTRLCDLSGDGNSVTSVAWNERGNLVAVGTHHGCVQVWDVTASKQVNRLVGHSARVGALAWGGEILSSGSRDRMILQRDVRTPGQAAERRLVGHRQEVCGLKWSPDYQYLASGGNDNRLYVWNMHSLAPLQTYTEHLAAVKAIAWSPHHHGLLASGGGTADRCIRFWNTLTGQPMQSVDTGSQVCNLAWSKHSSELVSTHGYSQNQILVWKYPTLSQVAKLTGHSYRVLYLAMSPDGEAIVTGAGDETLRFWNVFSKVRSQRESKSVLNLFSAIR